MKGIFLYFVKTLLLAAAYYGTGKLSLLLAIPPGFATPVWPAAGIALAAILLWGYRYLPAIFLGSFATNLLIASQGGADITSFMPIMIGSGIAVGALLQTALGAYLVKRVLVIPNSLSKSKDITSLLALGGLIGCMANALIGPFILLLAGIIPGSAYLVSAFTWWVGDVIGVVLFAPILLLLPNITVSKLRKAAVALPMLLFAALAVFIFFNEKEQQQNSQQVAFDTVARNIATELEKDIQSYLNILSANEQFINASDDVSRKEFEVFTHKFLKQKPSILSLSWNSKVTDKERNAYELAIRKQGFPDYVIKDRFGIGKIEPAEHRQVYFPVTYLNPYEKNEAAHGFDTYGPDEVTNNIRQKVLDQARDEARAIATGRISVVQAEGQYGLLIYNPVYSAALKDDSVASRRKHLIGYTAGVFVMPEMLTPISRLANKAEMDFILSDLNAPVDRQLLYDSRTKNHQEPPEPIAIAADATQSLIKLDVAGHIWALQFIQKADSIVTGKGWYLWYLLIGGLLFSGVFGIFLLGISANMEGIRNELEGEGEGEGEEEGALTTFLLPGGASIIVMLLSITMWQNSQNQQQELIHTILKEEIRSVAASISGSMNNSAAALMRMAKRWESHGKPPKEEWLTDAKNHVNDFTDLTTVEWIDSTFHVRWIEPLQGNEKAVGLDIVFNEERKKALEGAAKRYTITLTPPIDLVQGYRAVLSYAPIHFDNRFDGFILGIHKMDNLFKDMMSSDSFKHLNIRITDGDKEVFTHVNDNEYKEKQSISETITLLGREWNITIWPTEAFLKNHKIFLTDIVLLGGALFSLLVGFAVYIAMISNKRSRLLKNKTVALQTSEEKLVQYAEDLERKNIAIEESAGQLQAVMDTVADGLITIDEGAIIQSFNPAAEAIFGYQANEVINKNINMLMPEPYHSEHDQYVKNYKTSGNKKIIGIGREVVGKRKDGTTFPMDLSVGEARRGNTRLFTGIVRDITERKQMEIMKDEFISTVNHELRTPLTSIQGSLGLLKAKTLDKLDEKGRRLLELSYNNCERLMRLVNDILDIEKIAAGKMEYSIETVELGRLIHGIVDQQEGYAEKYKITFAIKMDVEEVYSNVDKNRFTQALVNLLSNAAKFSPEGEKVTVTLSMKSNNDVQISIADKGPGIPESFKNKIFQKFAQADSSSTRNKGGTGLGLNITKSIIEAFGGTVSFDSEEGNGTTFYFTLPVCEAKQTKET